MNYRDHISNLPRELLAVTGNGVTVAILDTGINSNHSDFAQIFRNNAFNFTTSPHSEIDVNGHGTHIAGLIGARGHQETGINGVANGCNLVSLKVINDNGSTSATNLDKALRHIISNPHIQIANLSMSINSLRYNIIENSLTNLINSQRTVVASAGNNDELEEHTELLCPANKPGIFAVGAVRRDFIVSHPNFRFNPKLDFLFVEDDLISCGIPNSSYVNNKGCSQSAALLSGIITLIKNMHPDYDYMHIKNYLSSFAVPYGSDSSIYNFTLIKP